MENTWINNLVLIIIIFEWCLWDNKCPLCNNIIILPDIFEQGLSCYNDTYLAIAAKATQSVGLCLLCFGGMLKSTKNLLQNHGYI